jgi:hypothetical protein
MPDETNENLKAIYQQLCDSYRAIDDFRAKLLGFLPLVSGGVFLLTTSSDFAKDFLGPIAIFGAAVTLGLLCYELYGIKKCHYLIAVGKQIETRLHLLGQFRGRPRAVFPIINEPFAAGVIYPAVLAVWIYLAFWAFTLPEAASSIPKTPPPLRQAFLSAPSWIEIPIAGAVFLVFFLGLLIYNIWLARHPAKLPYVSHY